MSNTVVSLRRKLGGAEQLDSVVRAMKAMAASSIGQYETAVHSLESYQRSVEFGLGVCLREGSAAAEDIPTRRGDRGTAAIVFGSDQGLVGRFNEVIAEFTALTLAALPGSKTVWAVGERVYSRLVDSGLTAAGQFAVPGSVAAIASLVGQIQIETEAHRSTRGNAHVYVFHNRPHAAALYSPTSRRLLPFDAQWSRELIELHWPTDRRPQILGDAAGVLRALVREYLFISLYQACAESLASEHGSRLAAMQRAEKNIEALSADLTQSLSRLRQGSIDEELFEVIAGFNSISRSDARTPTQGRPPDTFPKK